jgi:hypothetical protein
MKMNASTRAATLIVSLLMASALTPIRAADMTFERALGVSQEPQNWLLHHGNYQGHRFSQLKEINADTVKNLKVAFTVALGGFEGAGTRYKFGMLEATPIVEDGILYAPDGWGSVYAIDVTNGKKGHVPLEVRSRDRQGLGGRRGVLRRQQPRGRALEGQGDLDLARRAAVRHQQGDRREGLGTQDRRSGNG